MTDNPTPNDIALLREALITMGRMIPSVFLDDRVSNAFLASLPEEMAHYSLHRTSGQHDGAAGEGLGPHAVVIEDAEEDGFFPVSALRGTCVYLVQDRRQITMSRATAERLAAVIAPSTEQARAEGPRLDRARFMIRKAFNEWDGEGPFADMIANTMVQFAAAGDDAVGGGA